MLKAQVIGHLGKDALVNTVNNKSVINFTVAHSEKWKDAQGVAQEKTVWVDCSYWTDKTLVAQYMKKGGLVYVEGQPEARAYQKNDGTVGSSLSLRVGQVQLLGSKPEGTPAAAAGGAAVPQSGFVPNEKDDLPY